MSTFVKRIVVWAVLLLLFGCGKTEPTTTPVPPTATPVPPTATPVPPTPTATSIPSTPTPAPTLTPTPTPTPAPTLTPTPTTLPTPAPATAPYETISGLPYVPDGERKQTLTSPLTWTRPADGMLMLYVPGGEFDMGSSEAETEAARAQCEAIVGRAHCERRSYNESPVHAVALAGFWLDRTEVSNAQYALCVEDGACRPSRLADNASYNGDDYPVAGIPWQDAADYCAWAGGRLPTEAEWEYAARGSERRIYPWGDAFDCAGGNFEDDFTGCDDGYAHTAPVGSFPAGVSWCGALDLAGNVWEWVADWYGDYASAPGANPSGPTTGDLNVLRGGSWGYDQDGVRAAYRYPVPPDADYLGVGLRCAVSAPMQALPGPAQRDTLVSTTPTLVLPTDTPPPTNTPIPPTSTATPLTPLTGSGGGQTSSAAGVSFVDSGQRLGAGGNVLDAALGDLDGDGDLDAVVANGEFEEGNAVLLNDGDGVFVDSGQSFGRVSGLALGDLDGDGDLDAFAVALNRAGRVWLNDGGTFVDSEQRLGTVHGRKVALGDLDSDGDLDAFVAREQEPNVVWLNDGGLQGGTPGSFTDSGQSLGNGSTDNVALGDLDSDGDLDALTAGFDEPGIVWFNDGRGGLNASSQVSSRDFVRGVALGDADGDGDLDIFMTIFGAYSQWLWYNDGGTFVDSGQSLPGHYVGGIALGDLDSDGDLDAFIGVDTGGPDGVSSGNMVWLNDGGVFSDSGLRLGQASSQGIVLGDLDGDGDLDAFVVNREEFSVPNSHPEALITNKVWFNTTHGE